MAGNGLLVISHTLTHGPQYTVIEHARAKGVPVAYLAHPLPGFDRKARSTLTLYEPGREPVVKTLPGAPGGDLVQYAKDAALTALLGLRGKLDFPVCVAADSLNAYVALQLRRVGRVGSVVYYGHSYKESRFGNALLDRAYRHLDRACLKGCDATWNLSYRLQALRAEQGADMARNVCVPEAVPATDVVHPPESEVDRDRLVYLGLLAEINGVELLVRMMARLRELRPAARLLVLGGGPQEEELRALAKTLGVDDRVEFRGYVAYKDALAQMPRCALGLAPYAPLPDSTLLTSDPSKPKDYMACGLPVLMTAVGESAQLIQDRGAGRALPYDADAFAAEVARLLADEAAWRRMRAAARALGAEFDRGAIMQRAWAGTFPILRPRARRRHRAGLDALAAALTEGKA